MESFKYEHMYFTARQLLAAMKTFQSMQELNKKLHIYRWSATAAMIDMNADTANEMLLGKRQHISC